MAAELKTWRSEKGDNRRVSKGWKRQTGEGRLGYRTVLCLIQLRRTVWVQEYSLSYTVKKNGLGTGLFFILHS